MRRRRKKDPARGCVEQGGRPRRRTRGGNGRRAREKRDDFWLKPSRFELNIAVVCLFVAGVAFGL